MIAMLAAVFCLGVCTGGAAIVLLAMWLGPQTPVDESTQPARHHEFDAAGIEPMDDYPTLPRI
jgi:hypothetical protein